MSIKIDELREVINEQREEMEDLFREEKIIEREVKQVALRYAVKRHILAILGVRRSGKSILSYMLGKNFGDFLYINFDDERLEKMNARDLNRILEAAYQLYGGFETVILDEPQNVRGWELFANRLRRRFRVIITGSNSKLLSGELATALTGRHTDIEVFPFSFSEVLSYLGISYRYTTESRAKVIKVLEEYLERGGFPERFRLGFRIVREIYSDIITKDCIIRCSIKNAEKFRDFASFVISNFSNELSLRSISRIMGIKNLGTVSRWVSCLKESYLIYTVRNYSRKIKERVRASKKVYVVDTGIITATHSRTALDKGRLLENLVFKELRSRATGIFRWKSYEGYEVDFVLLQGTQVKQLIQVSYSLDDEKTRKRELKALVKASRELGCNNLLLLTWDEEGKEKLQGKEIKLLPVWKWLISRASPHHSSGTKPSSQRK